MAQSSPQNRHNGPIAVFRVNMRASQGGKNEDLLLCNCHASQQKSMNEWMHLICNVYVYIYIYVYYLHSINLGWRGREKESKKSVLGLGWDFQYLNRSTHNRLYKGTPIKV